jgi:hypothetical protein
MKASALVKHLTKMIAEHGDLTVLAPDGTNQRGYVTLSRPELATVRKMSWNPGGNYIASDALRVVIGRDAKGNLTTMPRWTTKFQDRIEAAPDLKVIVI